MVTLIETHGLYTVQINGLVVATKVTRKKAQELISEYDFT